MVRYIRLTLALDAGGCIHVLAHRVVKFHQLCGFSPRCCVVELSVWCARTAAVVFFAGFYLRCMRSTVVLARQRPASASVTWQIGKIAHQATELVQQYLPPISW